MEAVVLAGGFGTRLRAAVPDVPKPMAPIGNRPFLALLLKFLAANGISRVVLSLGYKANIISDYFGEKYMGMEVLYCIEESPLGTGGATRLALDSCTEDQVLVLNGDTFLGLEVDQLLQIKSPRRATIVGRIVEDTSRYGRLVVSDGKVIGFEEKGSGGPGIVSAGSYIFNKSSLDDWPLHQPFSLEKDYFEAGVVHGYFDLFVSEGLFIDIGIPVDFARAQTVLKSFC